MKNKMKSNIILAVVLLMTTIGYSQMTAAKMMPPNADKSIKINVPAQKAWNYLLKLDNLSEFGSKIIKENITRGLGLHSLRDVVFRDNTVRKEEIAVIVDDSKKLGISVLNPIKGFSRYFYYFEVKENKKSECTVTMKVYYGLSENTSEPDVKNKVLSEFTVLLDGLKQTLESKRK